MLAASSAAGVMILAGAGCHRGASPSANAKAVSKAPAEISEVDLKAYKPNEAGAMMVIMYHNVDGKRADSDMNRTPASFRKDLENLLARKYYPVTVNEIVTNTMNVPIGRTPVAITFDDSLRTQFNVVVGSDGRQHIDPDCAVGILETFHKAHGDDWPLKATFFVLPGDDRRPVPFYQPESVNDKFAYLVKAGCEIGNHTATHGFLRGMPADRVQWEIATPIKQVKQYSADVKLTSLAVPFGSLPNNPAGQAALIKGQSGGVQYANTAVLKAAWRPIMSPNDAAKKHLGAPGVFATYDPYRIERVQPNAKKPNVPGTLEYYMKMFDQNPAMRYVSDGRPDLVAVPATSASLVDKARIASENKKLQVYGGAAKGGSSGGSLSVD